MPTPGYAPGGRPINPATGRIADMPGGSDYLAGLGPAPAGLSAADMWSPAPVVHGAALGQGSVNFGQSRAIRPALGAWDQAHPGSGLVGMFNAMNQQGVQNPGGDVGQWYQNGLWGGGNPFYNIATGRKAAPNPMSAMGAGMPQPMRGGAPNPISGAYGSPFMAAGGAMPYASPGNLSAGRNTASYSGWSGGAPSLSSIRPQGAFQLQGSPTSPAAGFSTLNDPWGLGGM